MEWHTYTQPLVLLDKVMQSFLCASVYVVLAGDYVFIHLSLSGRTYVVLRALGSFLGHGPLQSACTGLPHCMNGKDSHVFGL